ncbi:MAG: radical SAM protein [Candidatus Kaelpia imicola]|nr:radical SAM protein [Candidatus Kaelpia imicola]
MLITPKRKSKISKFLRKTKLSYLPYRLGIEPGNICNLKCPLCPTGSGDLSMKKGFMELTLFKKIVDEIKGSISSLNFYSWGEPLLNPDFISMIEYVKKVNSSIYVTTSTNLNINNRDLLVSLVRSGIDKIIVSCDGITAESYLKYRVGGDFNLVMNNLKFIHDIEKRYNKSIVLWNFMVFKHNEKEVEKAIQLAKSLEVNLDIGKMRVSLKDDIMKTHSENIEKYKEWIPDSPEYSGYDKEKNIPKKIIKTCIKPWQEISINWDGKVFPCCGVYGDFFSLGNVKDSSIREVWNNELYRIARHEILNKKVKVKTICGICKSTGFMSM